MQKRTKIVCTIGPACSDIKILEKMVQAGMNVARFNFSHGTFADHKKIMNNIRSVEKKTNEPIAILQDVQGPKIRTGILPEEGVQIKTGQKVIFDAGIKEYNGKDIPVDYEELPKYVKAGERLLLCDGKVETKISSVSGSKIEARVIFGGLLNSHKGINVPDSKLAVRALTDKDKSDVKFGVENNVDMIALSFVQRPEDVLDLRYHIKDCEKELGLKVERPIRIIAKIERMEAVNNIKEILDVADGIMVARGDLGIEIPAQKVPLVQKQLIDEALMAAKPVIVATQMLDSMQNNPHPTRAEVSDVANAVADHTDAVMLSNETATGSFPVETVKMMSSIISETEMSSYDNLDKLESKNKNRQTDDVLTEMARVLAEEVHAKLILAASLSGDTGRMISRHRPELPILVVTDTQRVQHQLNLSWGVKPAILEPCRTIEELVERAVLYLKQEKLVEKDDKIIVVAGEPVGQAGHVNLLEVREVE